MSRGRLVKLALLAGLALSLMPGVLRAQSAVAVDSAPSSPFPRAAFSDSGVDAFYANHPEGLWLRDQDSRAAAAKLAERLRHAEVEGLSDGPALASSIEAALSRGEPNDDRIIAAAWIEYLRALNRPVEGVGYGEPQLELTEPAAVTALAAAAKAPSLSAWVDRSTAMNPLSSTLRANAIVQGVETDPRVIASLNRLRLVPDVGRAILVDVANAQLMTLENGRVIDSMKVIVGKESARTPLLAGKIYYVTFNPYWHIPQDVTRRKVAPIVLKRGTGYLKAARYETVAAFGGDKEEPIDPASIDWKAVAAGEVEAHIRQLAGPNNMMGAMKFGFVNDEGIYLHDTPHKSLFAKSTRTLSLGCVRVEQPERLAGWLLGREPVPPNDGVEQLVQLDSGVAIYILYLTARPDGDGIAFAPDVYGLDGGKSVAATARGAASTARQ